jgi:hypothetical protein
MDILYYHGGSGNHGCEALVRTLVDINKINKNTSQLYSFVAKDDARFGISDLIGTIRQSSLDTKDMDRAYPDKSVAYSIGGDNYCVWTTGLALYNTKFKDAGVKTALTGCSIDDRIFAIPEAVSDLKKFDLITARESITFKNLIKHGITNNTHLIPDSAFILSTQEMEDPRITDNMIGINASNIIENASPKVYQNYVNLIRHILIETDYNILLIPHVVQPHNDDWNILTRLKNEFNSNRIILINDCNCMQLKWYISKCKMIVCARTHCSIAGYSTCVPTLVLGYSTKSKGIATDIFGTYKNYVIPAQDLQSNDELTKGFAWLEDNYETIKTLLEEKMPSYKAECYRLAPLIEELKR